MGFFFGFFFPFIFKGPASQLSWSVPASPPPRAQGSGGGRFPLPAVTRRGPRSPEETLRGPSAPEDSWGGPGSPKTLCDLPRLPPPKSLGIGLPKTPPSFPEETSRVTRNFLLPPLSPSLLSPRKEFLPNGGYFGFALAAKSISFWGGGFPHGNLIPRWAAKETFCGLSLSRNTFPPPLPPQMFFWGTPQEIFLALPLRILQTGLASGP